MPRTEQEILDQAEALAEQFERYEPEPGSCEDAVALRDLRAAFQNRADAEKQLAEAVAIARAAGHSLAPWSARRAKLPVSGTASPFESLEDWPARPAAVQGSSVGRFLET